MAFEKGRSCQNLVTVIMAFGKGRTCQTLVIMAFGKRAKFLSKTVLLAMDII